MEDVLSIKDLAMATIGSTQLPGAARTFNRVVSTDASHKRLSNHLNANGLSPSVLRIAHTPRSKTASKQRSLAALDQQLTRLDAASNPVLITDLKVALQSDHPADVTLVEYRAAWATLLGAALANDGAMITAMFNGEF